MSADILERTLELAIAIQQIAAPTFAEAERAAYVQDKLRGEGLEVEADELHNVFARLPGRGEARPLVVSAHTDTVFPHGSDLTVIRTPNKISGAGIGDNSLGVAGLFGLLWMLRERGVELPGDLWLVADVGEEGLGDLRGMRAVVRRFGRKPLAYIVLEGLAFGRVYHRGLGSRRYRIAVNTAGGHSWVDYGKPSAVHELAALAARMAAWRLPAAPRTTLNVGIIQGGTSVNTIAPHASLELDLRSENAKALDRLDARVRALVEDSRSKQVKITLEKIGDRPAGDLPASHPLVKLAVDALKKQGVTADLNIASTDANIPLSKGLPAICIGLTRGGGAHTASEFLDPRLLGKGLSQLVDVVRGAFEQLA